MILNETQESKLFLGDKVYGIVKFLTIVVLPAIGTLYFALSGIWGLPDAQEVLGTILAIEAFIGAVLGISSQQYKNSDARYSGDINIVEHPDGEKTTSVAFNQHPAELDQKDEAVFKVNSSKKK